MHQNEVVEISRRKRLLALLTLIVAGETVFILPFIIARVFRPTLLEVFQLTNLELGTAFSVYGIVAIFSYFFGGPIADLFSARKLLSVALLLTALGGLFMYSVPELNELMILYGFWGFSTVLIFWAALIRATREVGGSTLQGSAFGVLEGGRGLTAALIASISAVVYSFMLPDTSADVSFEEKKLAFQQVILLASVIIFLVSIFVWLSLPEKIAEKEEHQFSTINALKQVLKMRTVWLQAGIIVSAYTGYKVTDDFALLAKDVLGYNDVDAAKIAAILQWMRPIGAILGGLLADRLGGTRMVIACFVLAFVGALSISLGFLEKDLLFIFFLSTISGSIGIYALRGLYYAIMKEGKIPLIYTGTAVGVVSVIGYIPDIFMGPVMGVLLDDSPGELGHRHVFAVQAVFALIGVVLSIAFYRFSGKEIENKV